METLYRTFRLQLENTSTDFVRFLHDRIVWESRLIAILGARGVGKTTLLLQHIKLYDKVEETLFVTADDFYFSTHRLFDLALSFYNAGGKRLYIDEVHKYKGWSTEIKNIYDQITYLAGGIYRFVYSRFGKRRSRFESSESGISFAGLVLS